MSALGTIITAMITPFEENGNVNRSEAARIATWLADRGNDGFVVAGSTGEGMTLDASERNDLVATVKGAVGARAAVIANIGTSDTRSTVRAAKEAEAAGADGVLVVVPPYSKPTQTGMIAHFGAIAEATRLPVLIYNIPGRTASNMLPETMSKLSHQFQNIGGVKESSSDLKQISTVVRDKAERFTVYCGDDHLFLPCLAVGAQGLVGVATHIASREYREMMRAHEAGDVQKAAAIHASLLELGDALFSTTNPIAIKWVMNQMGFAAGSCRLPLDEIPAAVAGRLRPLIAPYLAHA